VSIKNIVTLFSLLFTFSCAANLEVAKETADADSEKWPFAVWEECSSNLESHPCNFTLLNEKNEEVSLYDFYGKDIVLDYSAMWCGPCNMAASDINNIKSAYPEIVFITVLIDNEYGEKPTQEDLQKWVDVYEIKEPVLSGDRDIISQDPLVGWPISSWPTFFYINDKMVLEYYHGGYSLSTISQNIQMLTSN
tara:strand:+ start:2142 stop:2720 length:579 start_codon:yes stop_codon:yes gene_type:complete